MALLPTGFTLPPPPYLLGLAVGTLVVAGVLWRLAPAVTAETVLGLVAWMAVGSALHALYVIEAAPLLVRPLLGTPAVYGTAFIGLGAVWALAESRTDEPTAVARQLSLIGTAAFVLAVVALFVTGDAMELLWPIVGLLLAAVLAAGTWATLLRLAPGTATTGRVGLLVVSAHALDGVSTAIGVDVLGFGERTPASRAILDVAAGLPTADALGVGWLFVLVKLAVAGAVVALFVDFVEDDPRQGYLLLSVVAAVGLGPGVHNLLLYAVAG